MEKIGEMVGGEELGIKAKNGGALTELSYPALWGSYTEKWVHRPLLGMLMPSYVATED